MRKAFVESLVALAERDSRIMLLTADLGYCALEPFAERFPERFLNVGVAEQNMIAVATGLAEAGFVPYCYSIAAFSVLRPLEFIRNGPIAHRLPVRIVGMGGGFDYATNGLSHYSLEDLAVLRSQPGISLFAPADSEQTREVILATAGVEGPAYYRLSKDDTLVVPGLRGRFSAGRPELLQSGEDVLFMVTGSMAAEVAAAVEELGRMGVRAGLAVLASLNPVDREALAALLRPYRDVITVEAHYVNGGLGSLVAEIIAEEGMGVRLLRNGVTRCPDGITGRLPYMHARNGLDRTQLVHAALRMAPRTIRTDLEAFVG